jgi:hypothetical protein
MQLDETQRTHIDMHSIGLRVCASLEVVSGRRDMSTVALRKSAENSCKIFRIA